MIFLTLSINLQRVVVQSVPSQTNGRVMAIGVCKDLGVLVGALAVHKPLSVQGYRAAGPVSVFASR